MYDRLSLRNNDGSPIWTIYGEFSDELMDGLLIAGILGFRESANYNGEYFDRNPTKGYIEKTRFYINDYLRTDLLIESGIPYKDISREYTLTGDYIFGRDRNKFYTWIYNGESFDLYGFETEEFLQGIITMCNAFDMDYGFAMLSCPLYNGDYYYIEGINLPLLPEIKNGDPTWSLDKYGTVFPKLTRIEGFEFFEEYPDRPSPESPGRHFH